MSQEQYNVTHAVLSGIRVLDFGRYVAGPYCATLLGYLGADVIRIERRGGGEDRFIAPVSDSGEGAVILQTGCNKRSMTLDPTTDEGRQIIAKLVATADVVVANLPPSALASMGLDEVSVRAINARAVLVTQSAFGDVGPYTRRGGFDGVGQALSGAMYITGTPGAPAKAAAPYVDFTTAVLSAFGALAALMERDRSGMGQRVDATLLGSAMAVFNSHLIEQSVTGIGRVGTGNRVQTSAPSDVFATQDGHLLLHCVGNNLFRRWARLMGDEDRWVSDPRFKTDQSRADHSDEILARMRQWCAERTTEDALTALEAAGVPAGAVQTPQGALDDPQAAALGIFTEVSYPGMPRPAKVVDLPVRLSRTPGGIRQRPPTVGEHTDEILAELGFDAAAIADLKRRAVV
jgi:crotonobetainyl-CoA:carnitine CoA-transferase CaiB-like acyl-CoA transferase